MPDSLPFQQTDRACRLVRARRWEVGAGSATVGVRAFRSRRFPWLYNARAIRFGRGLNTSDIRALVGALVRLVRTAPVASLRIEAWSERPEERAAVAAACRAAGFHAATEHRSYTRTAWVDLTPAEDALLAGFHKTARRHIRAPQKKGFEVRTISQPDAARAVGELYADSVRRTGGNPSRIDWRGLIEYAAEPTARIHISGLFPRDAPAGARPLSFAVAFLHDGVAEYAYAGSVRDPDIRTPLLYAVAWELMRWARARGAMAWDFGGVTEAADADADDRLGGISDFKRYFSDNVITVGEEWLLEPQRGPLGLLRSAFGPRPQR